MTQRPTCIEIDAAVRLPIHACLSVVDRLHVEIVPIENLSSHALMIDERNWFLVSKLQNSLEAAQDRIEILHTIFQTALEVERPVLMRIDVKDLLKYKVTRQHFSKP